MFLKKAKSFFSSVVICTVTVTAILFVSAKVSAADHSTLLQDAKYFEIGDVQVSEIAQPSMKMMSEPLCDSSSQPGTGDTGVRPKFDGINLDDIINLGQKIWTIIEKNQPVVNLKIQKAEALPAGVSAWTDLECWQVPESRLFQVTYKNLYGMSVVDLKLRVNYTYGGRVNGVGRYLSQVTVLPAQLDVAWGFKLDANVSVVNVTNAGTRGNPVAGIQMDVNWVIRTPIKYSESTESFYVRGDGLYKQMQ